LRRKNSEGGREIVGEKAKNMGSDVKELSQKETGRFWRSQRHRAVRLWGGKRRVNTPAGKKKEGRRCRGRVFGDDAFMAVKVGKGGRQSRPGAKSMKV